MTPGLTTASGRSGVIVGLLGLAPSPSTLRLWFRLLLLGCTQLGEFFSQVFAVGLGEGGLFPEGFVESLSGFESEEGGGFQVSSLGLEEFKAVVGGHPLFSLPREDSTRPPISAPMRAWGNRPYRTGSARLTKAPTRTAAPRICHASEGLTCRHQCDIIMLSHEIGRQMNKRNSHDPHGNFRRVDGDGLRVVPFNPVSPAEPNV